MKNQKGITLIALVITIIVMMILVAVSVTVALNGGLFTTAKNAADETELEKDKEMTLSSGRIKVGETWYDSIEDYKSGKESENQGEGPSDPIEYAAYSIGDEVTVGGESFYVIEESGTTDSTVTLLAKYCLENGVQSQNLGTSGSTMFSSTNYWYNSETNTYETDLNSLEVPAGVTSVITTAKEYGEEKDGEGRLLTLDEANALIGANFTNILLVDCSDNVSRCFWLGTATGKFNVCCCLGWGETFSFLFDSTANPGTGSYAWGEALAYVRPVIEISKDLIEQ